MLKKLIIIGTFSLLFNVHAKSPSSYSGVKNLLQKASQKELISWLNDFIQESSPSRMIGLPGHKKARDFLKDKIKTLDVKKTGNLSSIEFNPDLNEVSRFYQNDFDQKIEGKFAKNHPEYIKWSKFTSYMKEFAKDYKSVSGENIVWEKTGINQNKILVVTAHYDTVSHDPKNLSIQKNASMPGANYNASGVVIALALIKALANIDLNYTVRVVFLDYQALAFLGSFEYANILKKSNKEIFGVINLEMLGQDSSYFDKNKKTGNMSLYLRNDQSEINWANKLTEHGSKVSKKISFEMKANNFESSDSFRFWEKGIQSVTFSQNWEDDFNPKFYQSPSDTPETLNHKTLYSGFLYIGGSVIGTLLDLTK